MVETLSSLFQKAKGSPIKKNGVLVHSIFRLAVYEKHQKFLISRMFAKELPVQGIRIKVAKGEIEVNENRHSDIILWSDTSPHTVPITVHSESGCELKIWNVWRIEDATYAWIGNAGMIINVENHLTTLNCSDGTGEINFSSLVIQIEKI